MRYRDSSLFFLRSSAFVATRLPQCVCLSAAFARRGAVFDSCPSLFAGQLLFGHFDQLLGHIASDVTVLSCSQVTLVSLLVVGHSQLVCDLCLQIV